MEGVRGPPAGSGGGESGTRGREQPEGVDVLLVAGGGDTTLVVLSHGGNAVK